MVSVLIVISLLFGSYHYAIAEWTQVETDETIVTIGAWNTQSTTKMKYVEISKEELADRSNSLPNCC